MPFSSESLNTIAQGWTGLMWAVLWQSTLLIGLVMIAVVLLRRSSPVVRYWLWQIVAIKLLLMPFWTLVIPLPSFFPVPKLRLGNAISRSSAASDASGNDADAKRSFGNAGSQAGAWKPVKNADVLSPEGTPREFENDMPMPAEVTVVPWYRRIIWQCWLLAAWLVILVSQFVRLLRLRIRLGRLLRHAEIAAGDLAAVLQETAERLELKRVPKIVLVDPDCSPFVCGILRPVIVLPKNLPVSLDDARMRQVLLHELAHVKRLDLLWGWIPELARVVYFFHPAVHWVNYRIRLERELCCDQLAMAYSGQDAAAYARTLVEVVSHASAPPVLRTAAATSAGLDGSELHILEGQQVGGSTRPRDEEISRRSGGTP